MFISICVRFFWPFKEFPESQGQNRYSWTWRSCFCYQILVNTRVHKEKQHVLQHSKFSKNRRKILLGPFWGPIKYELPVGVHRLWCPFLVFWIPNWCPAAFQWPESNFLQSCQKLSLAQMNSCSGWSSKVLLLRFLGVVWAFLERSTRSWNRWEGPILVETAWAHSTVPQAGITIIIIALQLLPFPGLPVGGFGFPGVHIYSLAWRIRFWGLKSPNLTARRSKLGNSIFSARFFGPIFLLLLPYIAQ